MKSSRDSSRSTLPKEMSRSATSGTPYRVTRSRAITDCRFCDQCGSE